MQSSGILVTVSDMKSSHISKERLAGDGFREITGFIAFFGLNRRDANKNFSKLVTTKPDLIHLTGRNCGDKYLRQERQADRPLRQVPRQVHRELREAVQRLI